MADIRVGGVWIREVDAWADAKTYLVDRVHEWAYPAYDAFAGGGDPNRLDDADLLAPTLLNVRVKLRGYYGLQAQRDRLQTALAEIDSNDIAVPGADPSLIGKLFSVLDAPGIPDVSGTTLAKILHRKRPGFIPLYDEYVRRCYQDAEEPRIRRAKSRTWSEFMTLLASAMRDDLNAAPDFWSAVVGLSTTPRITPLRALDIVAWSAGRKLLARP
ncbi:DUF6308 family protein [Polymorphospora sp. NPDC050346]|uniref:DUF6308 family protein n=1 Tax=Polymorphospora sp. NPDC050346 TaxID=3155780 RepID=UPI0033EE72A3